MPAQRPVFVKTPSLNGFGVAVAAYRATHMVDHPEAGPRDDARIGHVVAEPLDELLALPRAVQPVGVTAVTAADVDGHRQLGLDVEAHRGAVGRGGLDGRPGGDAGAGAVMDRDPRPAQLL